MKKKHRKKFTLRSKANVVSQSWLFATDRPMVIHLCAKYGKPMSNQNKRLMGLNGNLSILQNYEQVHIS